MWPPPIFISFTVVWFLNIMLAFLVYYQSRTIRRIRAELTRAELVSFGAVVFANALASRGATVPCDDCGNMMSHDVDIDILERPDGQLYVGHRSHNRRKDWGLA